MMERLALALALVLAACGNSVGPQAQAQAKAPTAPASAPAPWSPPASSWCLKQGADEAGHLLFIVVDLAYKAYPEKARFPYFVVVNVVIKDQNKNGHPTNAEADVLNAVEDQITNALFDVERTPFIGRMTTRGLREIMYHVRDPEQTNAILTRLAASPQPREWEFAIVREPDPTWKGVAQLFDDSPCL